MNLFVAVTDYEWFRFLRRQPEIEEVNFWQPSGGTNFRALSSGEPLLFKLHSPYNAIAGGGFFAHHSLLPHNLAWEFFGPANGARSFQEMEQRIAKYRRVPPRDTRNAPVGCILLGQPFFFEESDWIPAPRNWARQIVRGKGYDLTRGVGKEIWDEVQLRLRGQSLMELPRHSEKDLYGEPILVRPRLGQGTFRTLVMDTYGRRCAVTQEKALPALDAAHIRPVKDGGQHLVENGLSLRSDIHRLYDSGYVAVTPDHRFRVSRKLKDDFDNGEPYYPLEGTVIQLPPQPADRPNPEFLEWHSDVVFRG